MQKLPALQKIFDLFNPFIPKVNLHIYLNRKTYFCKNVFDSNYNKKALISYLTNSFKKGAENKHTNHLECYWAAHALHNLGYSVDVVDYDHQGQIDFSKYAVIYGFGDSFEKSFFDKRFIGKRIVYSPGCNTVYSNKVSAKRLLEFQKMGGRPDPELIRTTNNAWPLQKYLSDAIICLGNDFVLNTYKDDFDGLKYYQINCFPLVRETNIPIAEKNFDQIRNNLLWFGSQGSVHKGLDLALELVNRNNEIKLFIRGLNTKIESAVLEPYQHLIEQGRIDVKPYVDLQSDEFKELMMSCGAAIFPSSSEGGAAALLTVMTYGGLIPIFTKSCGLDIQTLGFMANEPAVEELQKALNNYLRLSSAELKTNSLRVQKAVSELYNQREYTKNIQLILQDFLRQA